MIIRKIHIEDIEAITKLYEQFWGEKSSIEKMTQTFNKIKDDEHYIHLNAFIDDQLVGTIAGVICEGLYGQCEPYMVIEDFIVDKSQRRKGIGKTLITEMEALGKKSGCCQIILITENDRMDAISFSYVSMTTADLLRR